MKEEQKEGIEHCASVSFSKMHLVVLKVRKSTEKRIVSPPLNSVSTIKLWSSMMEELVVEK